MSFNYLALIVMSILLHMGPDQQHSHALIISNKNAIIMYLLNLQDYKESEESYEEYELKWLERIFYEILISYYLQVRNEIDNFRREILSLLHFNCSRQFHTL